VQGIALTIFRNSGMVIGQKEDGDELKKQ